MTVPDSPALDGVTRQLLQWRPFTPPFLVGQGQHRQLTVTQQSHQQQVAARVLTLCSMALKVELKGTVKSYRPTQFSLKLD
jgi:hypothetical protein